MRLGWKEGRYGSTNRAVGAITMTTSWGTVRGQKHVASCPSLGVALVGFESHEAAQEALEREVEKKLEAALRALRAP